MKSMPLFHAAMVLDLEASARAWNSGDLPTSNSSVSLPNHVDSKAESKPPDFTVLVLCKLITCN